MARLKAPCHRCKKNKKATKLEQLGAFLFCEDCLILIRRPNPNCPECNNRMHAIGATDGKQKYQCTNLSCNNFKTYSESGEELGQRSGQH